MRLRAGLVALLALSLSAAPAAAQERSDVAAAKRFADAAADLQTSVRAVRPEVRKRIETFIAPDCFGGLTEVPEPVAEAAAEPLVTAFVVAFFDASLRPVQPALERFVTRLDRVRTNDRRLRRGRVAWRTVTRTLGALPAPPPDLCAQLLRWRDAGYAPEAAPTLDTAAIERLGEDPAIERADRQLAQAVRRLRALGISRRAAQRFGTEGAFEPLTDVLEGVVDDLPATPAVPPAPGARRALGLAGLLG